MAAVTFDSPGPGDRPSRGRATVDSERLHILLVEDDEDDYLITRDLLAEQDEMAVSLDWAASYEIARDELLAGRHDLYLVDYRLGEHSGLELIREAFAARPGAPVIMLSGRPVSEVEPEARALGASEFLEKRGLSTAELTGAIRHALSLHKAERHALAARATDEGFWEFDLASQRIYLSRRVGMILGLFEEAAEVSPEELLARIVDEDRAGMVAAIEDHVAGRSPSFESEFRVVHRDGAERWMLVEGIASHDGDGRPIRMAGSMRDTTARHVARERLEHEALHDALTDLPNRALFVDRVGHALARAGREPAVASALLFLDLDGFKQVNDTLSHSVGDELLIAFAGRVSAAVRPGDTVSRLGGDEFTVLLENLAGSGEAIEVAERILAAMHDPIVVDGRALHVGVSIGIALGAHGQEATELIGAADLAMYDAKRRGRGRWSLFDEGLHRRVSDRLARQDELREILDRGLLEVHFQPILDLRDGRVLGLEALARWPSGRDPLGPSEFIPIAEETGLIGALGDHVTRTALRALAAWRAAGAEDSLWVSVNLSPRELSDPAFADRLGEALRDAGVPASLLRLEMIESTLVALERNDAFLALLQRTGIGLHVDDFGTGHSSLTVLHRLPIRALKIARGFTGDLPAAQGRGMARSVIALARSLDVAAFASGIETVSQRDALITLGAGGGQGLLLAGPRDAVAAGRLLRLTA